MKAIILWIEGKKAGKSPCHTALHRKGHKIEVVPTIKKGVEYINIHNPDLTIVHLPSLRSVDKIALQKISVSLNGGQFVLLCSPDDREKYIETGIKIITLPLTSKNLSAAINSLLPSKIEAGTFSLNLDNNILVLEGREIHLTPRTARLLSMLMHHIGEVMERKYLFTTVWNTSYTGDTRSLDVHINWLRKAIEPNPNDPQYIITLRGLGYRLDI